MKVLHISTSDTKGGAARAAYRLHQGLQNININSQMLVKEKSSGDKNIYAPKMNLSQGIAKAKLTFDSLPLKIYRQPRESLFSLQWLPDKIVSQVDNLAPDIINLHWINAAYMQIETMARLKYPLVWTLHDMWAFTGGCHTSWSCDRYTQSCGVCPQLGSQKELDLSRWVWQRKSKAWKNLNLTIVTPSRWLAGCAQSSSLLRDFPIQVVPHGLNTQVYRPINPQIAREILKLPQDKQLILFGAMNATSDKNKGFHLLQPALQKVSKSGWEDKLEIVIFGASLPEKPPPLGFKSHYLGQLSDDLSLALVYSAADLMLVPSIQESFGQTASESLACGTPVVAFNTTGLNDIIDHKKNGYLAQIFEIDDLAKGITWVLEEKARHQILSQNARLKVEQEFSLELQSKRYESLFQQILDYKSSQG
ncbi:glycosyltransferase family 4 protein [Calothrix sp. 336/3]|uniref:glycosyltransferase family 4 protein n=1 Tax=Calothrix sp. 336/3 TaxID=1337936 RepID=UPI0004E43DE1|nr:glycosyltransferase family 4 protein [Calothrix sp. 336/3]AKG21134.1 glycosyl transferase [Calothrix sp. 336/3]